MKYIIFIFSYNSKDRTEYIYETLKKQGANVKVLENSTTEEMMFKSPDTIDLGRENIGLGGFHTYILENCLDENISFYGFFTNDIYGFSDNYIECMTSNFNEEIGILHSRVDNDMVHPWERIIGMWNGLPDYNFIEGVVPFYNYKVLSKYKSFLETPIQTEFYGTNDGLMSSVSNLLELHNIRINDCYVSHDRSGVRKSVQNNFKDYHDNAGESLLNFIETNPKLKEIYKYK
jgi:hypothetical protein